MSSVASAVLFVALVATVSSADASASPIDKIVTMLSGLQAKIISEGNTAQKEYEAYAAWCRTQEANLLLEIETGKHSVETYTATIEKDSSQVSVSITTVEECIASITTSEKEVQEATVIRDEEMSDFAAEEKELVDVIDTLERAIAILEREQAKHDGASMLQTELQHANTVADALKVMVSASAFSAADASKLTSLVQDAQASEESDSESELGAPDAATYSFKSSGIIETLEGLLEKAQEHLDEARKKEQTAVHDFEMLKVSLLEQVNIQKKVMSSAKVHKFEMSHEKATATGDLSITKADLAADIQAMSSLHIECTTTASDFDFAVKSRAEELKALAAAKKLIVEQTGGAESAVYGLNQVSFAQMESATSSSSGLRLSSATDLATFEVVRFVRDLGRKQNSPLLAQLASRISSAIHDGSEKDDVFAKVKGMIVDLIARLEAEHEKDANQNAWCIKQTSETTANKEEKSALVEKLRTKIDQMKSRSTELKEEVATLQRELAELAKSQAEMDQMRMEEKTAFTSNKADLEQGIQGVRMALKVLRDYYDTKVEGSAQGASSGIINLLEVVESDFSKGLSETTTEENAAQRAYDQQTKENLATKMMKDNDIKYKTKEAVETDKNVAELVSDLESAQMELDAILSSLEKINAMCIAKALPFEERKRRREAEIAGLREALEILQSETVLLQKREQRSRRALRGEQHHIAA